ncbi:hypothetical protein HZA44_03305 [Candidatus Peregrinibacteria bacterium]|nr:hypothetical protein [Candidatus Peregrinibacteria bacterium]
MINTISRREETAELPPLSSQEIIIEAQASRTRLMALLPEINHESANEIPHALLNHIQKAIERNPGALPKAAEELECTMAFLDAVITRYELAR